MANDRDILEPKAKNAMDALKWETAQELGLDDDLQNAGDELTVREAGKIGGNMVKKLIQKGEQALASEQSEAGPVQATPPPTVNTPAQQQSAHQVQPGPMVQQ